MLFNTYLKIPCTDTEKAHANCGHPGEKKREDGKCFRCYEILKRQSENVLVDTEFEEED